MDSSPGSQPSGTPPGEQPYSPPAGYTPPPAQPPQQYAPPQGYPPVPEVPAKKKSPLLIILLAIGGIILLCVLGVFLFVGGIFGATQPVVDAGEAYMIALRDGNYDRAFDLSSPDLQNEVGDASGLEGALSSKQPATWTFTSRSINNNDGQLSGNTTYKDGTSGTVEMTLTKLNNAWKVVGISLR